MRQDVCQGPLSFVNQVSDFSAELENSFQHWKNIFSHCVSYNIKVTQNSVYLFCIINILLYGLKPKYDIKTVR